MASAQFARCQHEVEISTRLTVEKLMKGSGTWRVVAFMCDECENKLRDKLAALLRDLEVGTPVNEQMEVDDTFHLFMNMQQLAFELAVASSDDRDVQTKDATKDMPVH